MKLTIFLGCLAAIIALGIIITPKILNAFTHLDKATSVDYIEITKQHNQGEITTEEYRIRIEKEFEYYSQLNHSSGQYKWFCTYLVGNICDPILTELTDKYNIIY